MDRQDMLKPCPFCGESNARICTTSYLGAVAHSVSCRTRDCHGAIFSLGYGLFPTWDEATTAWNARANLNDKSGEGNK